MLSTELQHPHKNSDELMEDVKKICLKTGKGYKHDLTHSTLKFLVAAWEFTDPSI